MYLPIKSTFRRDFVILTRVIQLFYVYTRGALPYWVILGMCGQNGAFSRPKTCRWVQISGQNLRMGHNFDIILLGNGWFSSKLNKTYCSLVNFCCK